MDTVLGVEIEVPLPQYGSAMKQTKQIFFKKVSAAAIGSAHIVNMPEVRRHHRIHLPLLPAAQKACQHHLHEAVVVRRYVDFPSSNAFPKLIVSKESKKKNAAGRSNGGKSPHAVNDSDRGHGA